MNTGKNFVVSKRPAEYLKQGWNHCGAFSVKGILSAYERDDRENPREYHLHWFGRLTGYTLGAAYWPEVLRSHGLRAKEKFAHRLTDTNRLSLLKELLSQNQPVMVRIGNGYLPNGKYNWILGRIVGHWITLWGYDDSRHVFYVYDSCVPVTRHDQNIPAGNTTRTYSQMLRDWRGGWWPWPWRYLYITVGEQNT